ATPAHTLPENWWTWPTALGKKDSDLEVTKRQWGAFYGTDLELPGFLTMAVILYMVRSPFPVLLSASHHKLMTRQFSRLSQSC
ncbi:hypothetical protein MJN85_32935, partial [Salmonella enterica subsp. enterica serovar Anatum]|nr:hypothetical protein [Salmonella enterica subsp. enterica serovar Anatum]